jgi:hypothetical protein
LTDWLIVERGLWWTAASNGLLVEAVFGCTANGLLIKVVLPTSNRFLIEVVLPTTNRFLI